MCRTLWLKSVHITVQLTSCAVCMGPYCVPCVVSDLLSFFPIISPHWIPTSLSSSQFSWHEEIQLRRRWCEIVCCKCRTETKHPRNKLVFCIQTLYIFSAKLDTFDSKNPSFFLFCWDAVYACTSKNVCGKLFRRWPPVRKNRSASFCPFLFPL